MGVVCTQLFACRFPVHKTARQLGLCHGVSFTCTVDAACQYHIGIVLLLFVHAVCCRHTGITLCV